jgi:hypothetical protein
MRPARCAARRALQAFVQGGRLVEGLATADRNPASELDFLLRRRERHLGLGELLPRLADFGSILAPKLLPDLLVRAELRAGTRRIGERRVKLFACNAARREHGCREQGTNGDGCLHGDRECRGRANGPAQTRGLTLHGAGRRGAQTLRSRLGNAQLRRAAPRRAPAWGSDAGTRVACSP